jgi:UDP:flavonoid glycosyltransferase YjiC (YdhE family)
MRILFTFAGGSGHLEPLVPLARAARACGHDVAFAGRPWMTPKVEALGFETLAAGTDRGLAPERRPLVAPNLDEERRLVGEVFAGRIARERAADLLPIYAAWQPDLVVWEEIDFGAQVAAERLGLPHAMVIVIAAGSFVLPELAAGTLDTLRAEHSLAPDPALAMRYRHLVLSPVPRRYRDPADPLPATAHTFRPFTPASETQAPAFVARLDPGRPTLYFTLGTVFNVESGDLYGRVLAGLRDLPVNVVVTVGRDIDPDELGPQPDNVQVEQFIPQATLLPHCDAVVCHGGSGSVTGALAHGLPLVILPMGADQPLNAARCAALGVARLLDVLEATPAMVREAAEAILHEPDYRRAAEEMRDEIAALPAPEEAVALLEHLMERDTSIQ